MAFASAGASAPLPMVTQPSAAAYCHTPWPWASAALPTIARPPQAEAVLAPPGMAERSSRPSSKPKSSSATRAPGGAASSSTVAARVAARAVGRSFAPRTVVPRVRAWPLSAYRVLPPERVRSSDRSARAPVVTAPPLLSTARRLRLPGVPWKSAAGTKRKRSLVASSSALLVATAGRSIQALPSEDHCQRPCAGEERLPVMATPANV